MNEKSFPIEIDQELYNNLDDQRKTIINDFIKMGLWKIREKEK